MRPKQTIWGLMGAEPYPSIEWVDEDPDTGLPSFTILFAPEKDEAVLKPRMEAAMGRKGKGKKKGC